MKRLSFLTIASIALVVTSCAPKALMMVGGDKLDKKISSEKTTVAVLPVVDWSEDEGFCRGYMLYGCLGAFKRTSAYSDVGLTVTNSLTESLWKKNSMKLVNKDILISKLPSLNITKDDLFPKHESGLFGLQPKYIMSADNTGSGKTPNYEKLYKAGQEIGADVVIIARVSKNTQANPLPQNPIGISIPGLAFPVSLAPTVAISAGYNYYRLGYKKDKITNVIIHIMALDVKNHEVIAFGGFNKMNTIPLDQKQKAMEDYSEALTFYAPLPEKEDLQKEFLAKSASYAGTQIANALLMQVGLYIPVKFEFEYNYADETWKQYPEGYFMKNFGLKNDEYKKLFVDK
jgi:hypothetical protein